MPTILTIYHITDCYKRRGADQAFLQIYATQELAKRGLIEWLLGAVFFDNITFRELKQSLASRLEDAVNLATPNTVVPKKINIDDIIDDILEISYEGTYAHRTIQYSLTEHSLEVVTDVKDVRSIIESFPEDDDSDSGTESGSCSGEEVSQ
jgi:hypothetical protein